MNDMTKQYAKRAAAMKDAELSATINNCKRNIYYDRKVAHYADVMHICEMEAAKRLSN
jgi:hypothetical protein